MKLINLILENKITILVIIAAVLLILVAVFIAKRKENFASLPLAGDKMLMITDSSGNIETLPLSSLHAYLKSIENDITKFKTDTSGSLTSMQASVNTQINEVKLDKTTINNKLSALEQQVSTFKDQIDKEINGIQLNMFNQTGTSSGTVEKIRTDLAQLITSTSVFQTDMNNTITNLRASVNSNTSKLDTQAASLNNLISSYNQYKADIKTKLDTIRDTYIKKGMQYASTIGTNFNTAFKIN